ncbi:hypothetical protein [Fibrobacter succinogenes]|uniref:hypothetical protein n=1 Tax=Fibrobacter succinogenes TaxID=833 RepID=UPI001567E3EE|nr:hypothetical protein [Fibrobacter succinogenes]
MFWLNDCAESQLEENDDPQKRTLLDWYCDEIMEQIKKTDEWKNISNTSNFAEIELGIKSIIKAQPASLFSENTKLLSKLYPRESPSDLRNYFFLLSHPKNDPNTLSTYQTRFKINPFKLFNYDYFFKKDKPISYILSKYLGCNVCIYCGRMYTTTIFNGPNKLVRPAFDHYFSKSENPLMALSFYNLIPSCNYCNSSIKGKRELNENIHYHPYIDTPETINQEFKFSYTPVQGNSSGIITLKTQNKAEKTTDFFYTEAVYQSHNEFELKLFLEKRTKYPKSNINTLIASFEAIGMNRKEFYKLLLGEDIGLPYSEELKRPLFKLKNDLAKEIFEDEYKELTT